MSIYKFLHQNLAKTWKNMKKADIDQQWPKHGSKYTTAEIGMVTLFKFEIKHTYAQRKENT